MYGYPEGSEAEARRRYQSRRYYQRHKRVKDARVRLFRARNKAAGLTTRGTPRKNAIRSS